MSHAWRHHQAPVEFNIYRHKLFPHTFQHSNVCQINYEPSFFTPLLSERFWMCYYGKSLVYWSNRFTRIILLAGIIFLPWYSLKLFSVSGMTFASSSFFFHSEATFSLRLHFLIHIKYTILMLDHIPNVFLFTMIASYIGQSSWYKRASWAKPSCSFKKS